MGKANLLYPPSQWWKVKAGIRHAEIKHLGTAFHPGDTINLHKQVRTTDRTYIKDRFGKKRTPEGHSMSVKLQHVISMSIVTPGPRRIMMKLNETPIPKNQANRIAKRCGYKSWKHLSSTMSMYYGLPFYGQILIW